MRRFLNWGCGLCLLILIMILTSLFLAEFIRPARTKLPLGKGCNGRPICDRKYTEVAYATTHNSFATSADEFLLPNHRVSMWRSLDAGIRGLMLDMYEWKGNLYLCHGPCEQGSVPMQEVFDRLADFLEKNPREVVTILWEVVFGWKKTWLNQYAYDLERSRLAPFLFEGNIENTTLGEMVNSNRRLVQFFDEKYTPECNRTLPLLKGEGASCRKFFYTWDFAVETDWNNYRKEDLSCDFNRGKARNPLYIINHFLVVDLISPLTTHLINWNPYLFKRLSECREKKFPNFPTVDFWSYSNVIGAADCLNGFGQCQTFAWWILPIVFVCLLCPLGLVCIRKRDLKIQKIKYDRL